MNIIQSIFRNKKVIFDTLEPFGFKHPYDEYSYTKKLPESGFEMTVTITAQGEVKAVVIDTAVNEPYTLHLAEGAVGSFVGTVRAEYETLLSEISEACFAADVFKAAQAKELIRFVRDTYSDEPEYLWDKFPNNAVWRRKDTAKWYGALLSVSKRKLGLDSDEVAEIIDLRIAPENMAALIDNRRYFPGWHMNKKNWYTVILDGSVSLEELQRRIAQSYSLATK